MQEEDLTSGDEGFYVDLRSIERDGVRYGYAVLQVTLGGSPLGCLLTLGVDSDETQERYLTTRRHAPQWFRSRGCPPSLLAEMLKRIDQELEQPRDMGQGLPG